MKMYRSKPATKSLAKEQEAETPRSKKEKQDCEAVKKALREICDRRLAGEYSTQTCIDKMALLLDEPGHCKDSVKLINDNLDFMCMNLVDEREEAYYEEMEERAWSGNGDIGMPFDPFSSSMRFDPFSSSMRFDPFSSQNK